MYVAFALTTGKNESYRLRDIVGFAETDSIGVTALRVYDFEGIGSVVYVADSFSNVANRIHAAVLASMA